MVKVRKVQRSDYVEVKRIGRAMHAESYYSEFDYSDRKIHHLFESALNNPMFFGRVFVDANSRPIGYFLGFVTEHYFGYDTLALDLGLYIEPDYRGKGAAAVVRCIKDYEKWAKSKGVKDVVMGVSAGITDDKSIKLYERLGYSKGSLMLHKKVH